MTIEEIISRLKEGNQRFTSDQLTHDNIGQSRKEELSSGQSPYAIILSCADSRVVPEMAFDAGLGELFVVRVAGNIANTDSMASIEYAVAHLKSQVIIVLGHESCGAVTAAMAGGDNGKNLNHLLEQIQPAVDKAKSEDVNTVVKCNAQVVAERLVSESDIISQAVGENKVKIIPAYYNLSSGKIDFL